MRSWISKALKGYRYWIVLVYSDLFSGLLPAFPPSQRGGLAVVLHLWTFILSKLATDLLWPGAFAIKSQLRFPTDSSLPKFLNFCFPVFVSRSFWWTWRLLLAIPEPKMNQKCLTTLILPGSRGEIHTNPSSQNSCCDKVILLSSLKIESKANTLPVSVRLCFAVSSWNLIAI